MRVGLFCANFFLLFQNIFYIQFEITSSLILLNVKVPSERSWDNRSNFMKYMVLKIAKLSCNVSPYRWDTLYKQVCTSSGSLFRWAIKVFHMSRMIPCKTPKASSPNPSKSNLMTKMPARLT